MPIIKIETPNAVTGGLISKIILLGKWLLREVHKGTPDIEVGLHLIVDMGTHHGFRHHTERVVLTADTNGSSAREDAFIDDTYRTHGIIHRVVDILNQRHTTCSNCYRPLRDTIAQRYLTTDGAGIIAFEIEFVLVGILLSQGPSHGIKGVEAIFFSELVIAQQLS